MFDDKDAKQFIINFVAAYIGGLAALNSKDMHMPMEHKMSYVLEPDVEDALFQAKIAWKTLQEFEEGNI